MSVGWDSVSKVLEARIGKEAFERWFANLKPVKVEEKRIVLEVKDDFTRKWLINNYLGLIKDVLWDLYGRHIGVEFTQPDEDVARVDGLNERFTFEEFVEGPCNSLALAAARMIAEEPGRRYNPLFIYGGVGLGKTHLLQAITHHVAGKGRLRVLYISGETLLNDVLEGVKKGDLSAVRHKYRTDVDMLIVDDIQILTRYPKTKFVQEEFFNTFNELHSSGKQVVLSSDRPPIELAHLHERLRSRFQWGLTVELGPPNLETRRRIILKKLKREQVMLPPEVVDFVAEHYTGSVREIEGAVNRLTAYKLLKGVEIDLAMARRILDPAMRYSPVQDMKGIVRVIADHFGVTSEALTGKGRTRRLNLARGIAYYILRETYGYPLTQIGELFHRSHTTVLSSFKHIKKLLEESEDLKRTVRLILRELGR